LETHFSSLSSPSPDESAKQRHLGELLDDGLKLTFPASDPVAPFIEEHPVNRIRQKRNAERAMKEFKSISLATAAASS
jgi:hypothetical protein